MLVLGSKSCFVVFLKDVFRAAKREIPLGTVKGGRVPLFLEGFFRMYTFGSWTERLDPSLVAVLPGHQS